MRHKRRAQLREWLLPPAERRAARLEREVEERIRSERDWHCERSRQLLHDEAERRKHSIFLP